MQKFKSDINSSDISSENESVLSSQQLKTYQKPTITPIIDDLNIQSGSQSIPESNNGFLTS